MLTKTLVHTFNEEWYSGSEVSDADGVVSCITDFHVLNLQGVGQTVFGHAHIKLLVSLYFLFPYLSKNMYICENNFDIPLHSPGRPGLLLHLLLLYTHVKV